MSPSLLTANEITFDQVFALAQKLRPIDQVRLIARLAPKVERVLEQAEATETQPPRKPLRGLLADLGPAPSAEEIDEVRQEMWTVFVQGDLCATISSWLARRS